jgi:tetratricopeptide (TPR) repeat protein
LSRQSPPARALLQVAEVAGDGFTFDLIEAATRLQPDALLDALDEALREDTIREEGDRFQFGHTLIRQTVYRELNAARRARLHRQVAEALEQLYVVYPEPHLAELAHHLFQAGGAEHASRAIGYARRAAERAIRLLAYEDAVSLYELALRAADLTSYAPEERCDLLLALGDARRRSGQLPGAMDAFQEEAACARALGSPERLANASLGFEDALLAAGTPRQGPQDPSIVLQQEALHALGQGPQALRARVQAALGRAMHFSGLRDEAAEVTQQAVDLARAAGDDGALPLGQRRRELRRREPPPGRGAPAQLRLAVDARTVRPADEPVLGG